MRSVPAACCAHCRWWDAAPDQRNYAHHAWHLNCRRHAPVVVMRHGDSSHTGTGTDVDTEWPRVRGDAWCGDFVPWQAEEVARG